MLPRTPQNFTRKRIFPRWSVAWRSNEDSRGVSFMRPWDLSKRFRLGSLTDGGRAKCDRGHKSTQSHIRAPDLSQYIPEKSFVIHQRWRADGRRHPVPGLARFLCFVPPDGGPLPPPRRLRVRDRGQQKYGSRSIPGQERSGEPPP